MATVDDRNGLTVSAMAEMNSGSSLSDCVRVTLTPRERPYSLASMSRSYRISKWSETNPTGQMSISLNPFPDNSAIFSLICGPSQESAG